MRLDWIIAKSNGSILKREYASIPRTYLWRCLRPAFVFTIIVLAVPFVQADTLAPPQSATGSTNSAPITAPQPINLTNPAANTFLQSHPELAQPSTQQPPTQALTLSPAPPPTNAPPEVIHSNPEATPESFPLFTPPASPEDLAAHLLVVYNTNDPDSKSLADYYASKRDIPPERVLGIACPTSEEITRKQYDETIRMPILSYLMQKNWLTRQNAQVKTGAQIFNLLVATHNDIWAMVLMRGVPLKIAPDPDDNFSMETEPELRTDAAAVDSELALLPIFGLPKGGYVPNIFFDTPANGTGIHRVGPELARNIILVTRLDAPKVSDVRRMIDDTLFAEKNRLAGLAVIDTRGVTDVKNMYISGDTWLRAARDTLVQDGWAVKFDDKAFVLPPSDPCNHVALYLGWYSGDAQGPWVTAPDRFVRGAIAYHLHSFNASTLRSETSTWAGPLLAHGAAATMGMVYEPYLALTPHEDIFARRLLEGDYFAEAAYASERGLSWMVTVIGDPLYRPFRVPLDDALASMRYPHTDHDDWLLLQKIQRDLAAGRIEAKVEPLRTALDVPGAGAVAEEGLGDLLEKLNEPLSAPAAEMAYRRALGLDTEPVDKIRVGLKLAQHFTNRSQDELAQAELRSLRELCPQDAERFGVVSPLVPTSAPTTNPAPK